MKNPVKEKKTSKVGPLDDAGPISFFFLLFDRHLHHHNLFNGLIWSVLLFTIHFLHATLDSLTRASEGITSSSCDWCGLHSRGSDCLQAKMYHLAFKAEAQLEEIIILSRFMYLKQSKCSNAFKLACRSMLREARLRGHLELTSNPGRLGSELILLKTNFRSARGTLGSWRKICDVRSC